MPDNKRKTRPQDSGRVNVNEAHELRYWTEALGVTKERLIETVRDVGTSATAVKNALKSNR